MRKSRFSEEQIVRVLHKADAGVTVRDICREHNISEQTFYRWRSKYGGMAVSDVKRLKELETENARLKGLLADKILENDALEAVIRKNAWAIRRKASRDCPSSAPSQRASHTRRRSETAPR